MSVQDKLPQDISLITALRNKLDRLDEKQMSEMSFQLPFLKLKSPTLVFWVGSFLFGNFGVGRFMIGDKGLGGVRLGLTIATWWCGFMYGYSFDGYRFDNSYLFAGIPLNLVAFIWWIGDLFWVGPKLRKRNFNKIAQAVLVQSDDTIDKNSMMMVKSLFEVDIVREQCFAILKNVIKEEKISKDKTLALVYSYIPTNELNYTRDFQTNELKYASHFQSFIDDIAKQEKQ